MPEDKSNSAVLVNDNDAIVNMVVRRFVAVHGRLPRLEENVFDDDDLIGLPNLEIHSLPGPVNTTNDIFDSFEELRFD